MILEPSPVHRDTASLAVILPADSLQTTSNAIAVESEYRGLSANSTAVQRSLTEAINAATVQQQAAANSPLAMLLENQACNLILAAKDRSESVQKNAALQANFLRMQAIHQRNVSAGLALQAYWGLVSAGEQRSVLNDIFMTLEQQQNLQDSLVREGMFSGDTTEVDRNRISALSEVARLEGAAGRLSIEITASIGHAPQEEISPDKQNGLISQSPVDIWQPDDNLIIQPQMLDLEQHIQLALSSRRDLAAWRMLRACVNEENAIAIDSLLPQIAAGLATHLPALKWWEKVCLRLKDDKGANLAQRRKQLDSIIVWLEDQIRREVSTEVNAILLAYQQVELAQQVIATWDRRLEVLAALKSSSAGDPIAEFAARAAQASARSTLIQRQTEARLAEVRLAAAIGSFGR